MKNLLCCIFAAVALVFAGTAQAINCQPSRPYTTSPLGNTTTFSNISGALNSGRFNLSFWRLNCSNGSAQLLMTVIPTTGQPLISPLSFQIRQGSIASGVTLWGERLGTVSAVNIEAVSGSKTFLVDPLSSQIDERQALTFVYNEVSPNLNFSIPASSSTGGSAPTSKILIGALSGIYSNSLRGGEGIMVDIGTVGARNVIFIAMFTYNAGRQRWLVGNVDFNASATSVDIPMIETSNGEMLSANSALQSQQVGVMTLSFPDCSTMSAIYRPTQGPAKGFTNTRLVGALRGVACN